MNEGLHIHPGRCIEFAIIHQSPKYFVTAYFNRLSLNKEKKLQNKNNKSSTSIHFHLLSSIFIYFHPLSSAFIHFHPISSTSIHFHPFSSTFRSPQNPVTRSNLKVGWILMDEPLNVSLLRCKDVKSILLGYAGVRSKHKSDQVTIYTW